MRAKGTGISWRKSKVFPSFLRKLNDFAISTRNTWRNLHIGHALVLGLFLVGAVTALTQSRSFETLAANHTLRINAGKISGSGNIFNVNIVDKSLLDTQPAGTDPNSLNTFGTYGGITTTQNGSNSLYTISSLSDQTNYSFKLVAPLSATADTTYKFYDWQGCNDVEDNYKADWTPGQDGIPETCVVTYNKEQTSYIRDITARFASPNSINILTSGTNIAVYQQYDVKVIDKNYYDTLPSGTDPNSLTTFGTYGGKTSAPFYNPNGAYNYSISVPADQRFISLVFPTFHPISDSYIWDLGGSCIQEDNYKADWTPGQDGIPETCKIDFGENARVGGINRISSNYVEVRYTKNIINARLYSTDNTPLNINTIKLIDKSYYDTLPSGTNPSTLNTYGQGGGVFAVNSGSNPYWYSEFAKGIPAKKSQNTFNNAGNYLYKAVISQLTDSGKAFEGFVCNGSLAYPSIQCEDNYKADWTPGQDGIFETIVIPITDSDGGTTYPAETVFNDPKLKVITSTNNSTDAGFDILNDVKIFTKDRYETLYPSAGTDPNLSTNTNYGTYGGTTSSNYNNTSYKLQGGYYYAVNGGAFSTKLIAPLTATNDTAYTFTQWSGCSSTEDNFDGGWNKTTNNGGTATADGRAETCVINFNDGLTHSVRALYQSNNLTVVSQTYNNQNANFLSINSVRFIDPDKWVAWNGSTAQANPNGYATNHPIYTNYNPTSGYISINQGLDGYYYSKDLPAGTYKVSAPKIAANNTSYTFVRWVGCDNTADYFQYFSNGSMKLTSTSGYNGADGTADGINETCIVNLSGSTQRIYAQYTNAQLQVTTQTLNTNESKFLTIDRVNIFDVDVWNTYYTTSANSTNQGYNHPIFVNYSPNAGYTTTDAGDEGYNYTKSLVNGTYKLAAPQYANNDPEYGFAGWVGCDSTADYFQYFSNGSMQLNSVYNAGYSGTPDGINETCIINLTSDSWKKVYAKYSTNSVKVRITTPNPTDINAAYLNARFVTPTAFISYFSNGNGNIYSYGPTASLFNQPGGVTDNMSRNGSYYVRTFASITNGQISAPPQAASNSSYTFVGWSGCDSTADYFQYFADGSMKLTSTYGTNYNGVPDGINETCIFSVANGAPKELVAKYQRTILNVVTKTSLETDPNYLALDNVKIRDWELTNWATNYANNTNDPNQGYYSCSIWNGGANPYAGGSFGGCTSTLDPANGWKYTRGTGSFNKRLYAPYYASNDSEYKFVQWQGCDSVQDNATTGGALGQDGIFETCVIAKGDGNSYTVTALYKRTTLRVYTTTDQPGNADYSTIDNVRIRDLANTNWSTNYANNTNDPNQGSYSCSIWNSGANPYAGGSFGGCTSTDTSPNGWYYERRDGVIQTRLLAPLRASNDTEYTFNQWNGCESVQDNFDNNWEVGTDGIFETCVVNFSNGLLNTVTAQYRKLDTRIQVYSITESPDESNYTTLSNVKIRDLTNTPTFTTNWNTNDPNAMTSYSCGNSDPWLVRSDTLGTYGGCTKNSSSSGYSYTRSSNQVSLNGSISTKLVAPLYATSNTTYSFTHWNGCNSVEDNFDKDGLSASDGVFETCVLDLNNGEINTIQAVFHSPATLQVFTSTTLPGSSDYTTISNVRIKDVNSTSNNDPNVVTSYSCGNSDPWLVQSDTLGTYGGCTKNSSSSGYSYSRISSSTNPYGAFNTKLIAPLTASSNTSYFFQNWTGCTSVEDNFNAAWNVGQDGVFETCVINTSDYTPVNVRALYSRTQITVYTSTANSNDLQYTQIDNVKVADFITYNGSYVGTNPNNLTNAQLGTLGSATSNASTNGYYYTYSASPTVAGRLVAPLTATNDPGLTLSGWSGCNSVQDNFDAAWNKTTNNGGTATPDGVFETCQFSFANNKPNELRAVYTSSSLQVVTQTVQANDPNFALIDGVKIKDIGTGTGAPVTFDPNSYNLVTDLGTFGGVTTTVTSQGYAYIQNASSVSTRLIAPLTATNDPAYRFVAWVGCDSTQDNYDTSWNAGNDGRNETCVVSVSSNGVKQVKAQYRKETTDVRIVSRTTQSTDSNYATLDGVPILSDDIYSSYTNRDPTSFSVATGYGQFGGVTNTSDPTGYFFTKTSGILNPITTRFIAPLTAVNDAGYVFTNWTGCDSVEDNYTSSWTAGTDGLFETCVFNRNDGLSYTLVAQYQKTTLTVYTSTVNPADTNYNGIDGVKIVSGDAIGFNETRDSNGRLGKVFDVGNANASPINNYVGSQTLNTKDLIREGKMRPDCGDIRVFANSTPIPYDSENCNTETTKIIFKVASLPTGKTPISIQYGKLSDTSLAIPSARWYEQDLHSSTQAPDCTISGTLAWDTNTQTLVNAANTYGGACTYSNINNISGFYAEYEWAIASNNSGYAGFFFGGDTMDTSSGDTNSLPVNTYYLRTFNGSGNNRFEILKKTGPGSNSGSYNYIATGNLTSPTLLNTYRKVGIEYKGGVLRIIVDGVTQWKGAINYTPFGDKFGLYGTNYNQFSATYQKKFTLSLEYSGITFSPWRTLQAPTITSPLTSSLGDFGGNTTTNSYPLGYAYQKMNNYVVTTLFPRLVADNDSDYGFDSWSGCDMVEDNYKADWSVGQDGKAETCYVARTRGENVNVTARYKYSSSRIEVYSSTVSSTDPAYNSIDGVKIVSDNAFGNDQKTGNEYIYTVEYNNTGTTVNNALVSAQIDTRYLIATGKMRSDCGDIRVYDASAALPIAFDIVSCNNNATQIYIKVSTLDTGLNTFKIKYGNFNNTNTAQTSSFDISDLNEQTNNINCTITGYQFTPIWDNTNKFLRLSTISQNTGSSCAYELGRNNDIDATFDARAGGGNGATGISFTFGASNPYTWTHRDGYRILFNEYSGRNGGNTIEVAKLVNDVETTLNYVSVPLDLDDFTWRTYRVQVDTNGNVKVYINGTKYLDYTIAGYASVGTRLALESWTGGLYNYHDVKNLLVRRIDQVYLGKVIVGSTRPASPFDPNLANGSTYSFGDFGLTTTKSSARGWFNTIATSADVTLATRLYAPLAATNDPEYTFSQWSGCGSTEDNYKADWTPGQDGVFETCVVTKGTSTQEVRAQYVQGVGTLTVYSSGVNPQNSEYNTINDVKFVSIDGFINETYNAPTYTRTINVTNSGATLTNAVGAITFDTAALISKGKMRNDCGDIRVLQGASDLSYNILNCNAVNTLLYFQIPTISTSATLSLTYGDLTKTSQSNSSVGANFADLTNTTTTPVGQQVSTQWNDTNKELTINPCNNCAGVYYNNNAPTQNFETVFDFKSSTGGSGDMEFYFASSDPSVGGSSPRPRDGYWIDIANNTNVIILSKRVNDTNIEIERTSTVGYNTDQWNQFKAKVFGNVVTISINGIDLLSANTIVTPAGTYSGVRGYNGSSKTYSIRNYSTYAANSTVNTVFASSVFDPNTANGSNRRYGEFGGIASNTTVNSGYYYKKILPGTAQKIIAPITATNDPTYSLTGWTGCDSVEDNYTNAWTSGSDGIFETCVVSSSASTARVIRAQYSSSTTILNVYSRTLNVTDTNFNQIDNVKIISNDKYLSTAERNPNNFTDAMGYGDYGNKTNNASVSGYFFTKNSFTINGTNTIATQLIAPLTATNDPTYVFDSWLGCDALEDNYNSSWNLGTDGINETCVVSFSNGISNNVYALYKRTTLRVVTSTANAANPEYLGVDAVKIVDKAYYTTLGVGTDPNSLTTFGTLGNRTSTAVADGYQYTYASGSISGSLVAPLTATNDPTFQLAGWTGCSSTEDNYKANWTLGQDGVNETCVINFANGDVNTVRAVYQPPTRVTVNAVRPSGSNNVKIISQDAIVSNGSAFNPALAGTSTYTFGTIGGTASYQYSSYNAITTSLYPEHQLSTKEVFTNWTGCTSTQDNYKADWTAGTDGINETCVINFNNNTTNTVTANYRAPASLNVDAQKPLPGNAKVVSQSAFTANGSAFDPGLAGTSTYTYGAFGGTTAYTVQDGYIATKLYPQLTLSTNEVFDSWTGCDSVEDNYNASWNTGTDGINETCVVTLTNATPRSIRAIYKVTTLVVRTSTITPSDSLYNTIDNVKIVDKSYYDTLTSGTNPNTLTTYGNLGGSTTTFSANGYFYSKNFATITGRLIAPLTATNDPAFDFRDWVGCDSVEDNYDASWNTGTDGINETCVVNFTNYTTNTIQARYGKTSIKVLTRTTSVSDTNYTLIDNVKIVDKTYYDTQTAGTDPNTLTSYGTLGNKTTVSSSNGYYYNYKNYAVTGKLVAPLTASNDPNYTFISWSGCDSVEDNYDASWNTGTDGKAETCVFNFDDGVEHQLIAQYKNVYTGIYVVSKGTSTDPEQYQIDGIKIVDKTYYDTQTAGTDPNTLTSYGTWGDVTATLQNGVGYYYTKQSSPNGSITAKLIAPEQATNDSNHFFSKWIGCDSYEDNYTINWQPQGTPTSVISNPNASHETCVINLNNGLSNQITAEYKFIAPASTLIVHTQTNNPTDFGYDTIQSVKIASQGYAGGDPSQYNGVQLGTFGGITTDYIASQGYSYTITQKPIVTILYPSMVDPTDSYSFRGWTGCTRTEDNYTRGWVLYAPQQERDNVFETCVIEFDDGLTHDVVAHYTQTQLKVVSQALDGSDPEFLNIHNVKIASQGYAGGDPNSLGAAQLGTYGDSTRYQGNNTAPWFYTKAIGAPFARLYAPLLATNNQTYIFTGWYGCKAVEDNFKGDWTPGGDGIAETCVIDRNFQYEVTVYATFSQTKVRVFANTYSNSDPRRNNVQGVRVASQGYTGGDPATTPTQDLGPFGGDLTQYVNLNQAPFASQTYFKAASTIQTELYAPLVAKNDAQDPYDDYKFVEWGLGCDSTLDKYDANWVLTTDYGGTATPDGLKETCVINKRNGQYNNVVITYSGDLVRVNVNSARYSAGSANITGVKILEIPYNGPAPAINDPNTYAVNTLGAHGGLTNYQINESGIIQTRLVAPFTPTNNPDYDFRDWYNYYGGGGCTSKQDNYDANFNLGQDGIFETCVINQSTAATLHILARYKQTALNVGTVTLNSLDPNYSGIDNVKIAATGYPGGDPNQYSLNQLGTYGGITDTFQNGAWHYTRSLAGSFNTRLYAPLVATNDLGFNFVQWEGCDSVEDNFDGIWNTGTDGRFETCVIAANDGGTHGVTARYSNQVTRLEVYSGTENNGSISHHGSVAIRDIAPAGTPAPDHNPNNYFPDDVDNLGDIGGVTNKDDGSKYIKEIAGPGNMVNGTIDTRLVAPWQMLTDSHWQFWKWVGCDSTQDLYDKEFNYGVTDGINETCVITRANGQTNRIHAIYQQKTIIVHSRTPSAYDADFEDIDNVKILEYGWGNPALTAVADPNTLNESQLGYFGGITKDRYYYGYVNKSDWAYWRSEGYLYETRLIAPLYATNDPDYGFVGWDGCTSVEDNFNGFWQAGTDGKAETCVIESTNPGNGTSQISAIYDDAKSTLTVASNIGSVPITSPDADWNGFNTPRAKQKVGINTSFRVPSYIIASPTKTYVFSNWTGCTSTQDNYKVDGTTLGQDGISETCIKGLADATSATVTAIYTTYDYTWDSPTLDQPTVAALATGINITSGVFRQNGVALPQGYACENRLQYIEPSTGTMKIYTSTLNSESKCVTAIPSTDIPTLGRFEISSKITASGVDYISTTFAPNKKFYVIDSGLYPVTLSAYYNAGHPEVTQNGGVITDLSNNILTNASANNYGAVLNTTGIPRWTFNGASSYIKSNLRSDYNTDITFEVWYKRSSTTRGALVSQYRDNDTLNRIALMNNNDDTLSAKIDQNVYATSDFISGDYWQMGTVTYNTSDNVIRLYANGVFQKDFNNNTTLYAPSSAGIDIGKAALGDFFQGDIAEIRIYKSALPEMFIRQNFEAQKAKYGFTQPSSTIKNLPLSLTFGSHPFSINNQFGNDSIAGTSFLDRRAQSSAWNVTVSSTPFTSSKASVDASNINLSQANDPTRLMGSPKYVTYGADGNLAGNNIPKTILDVSQFNGSGEYPANHTVNLTIPGYTPPANYTATITVTTTSY